MLGTNQTHCTQCACGTTTPSLLYGICTYVRHRLIVMLGGELKRKKRMLEWGPAEDPKPRTFVVPYL